MISNARRQKPINFLLVNGDLTNHFGADLNDSSSSHPQRAGGT
jgi:hypothetical protein